MLEEAFMTSSETANYAALSNVKKAALIISSLGLDSATKIFKELSMAEMEDVSTAMMDINLIPVDSRMQVLNDFAAQMKGDVEDFELQGLLEKCVGRDKALLLMSKVKGSKNEGKYFEFLNQLDPRQFVSSLQAERPQTLALILCHINPRRAAEILAAFPADFQAHVVARIANMDRIAPEIVRQVEANVRKKLSGMPGRLRIAGGYKAAAQVISNVDRSTERKIFAALTQSDAKLAQEVKKLMLVFEDLIRLSDSAIQILLKDVDIADICLALKNAPTAMKEAIQRNLSKRAAERLAEELDMMGPKPRSEIEAAQQRIVSVARRLEDEGKLNLGRSEKEDELVA
ncbi:MAG: flagellar motor switch protein FliG [Planctomycetota bacterium]